MPRIAATPDRLRRSAHSHLIAALSGATVAAWLGAHPASAEPQRDDKPDAALTPYVEAHTHFEASDPEKSVRSALAALSRQTPRWCCCRCRPTPSIGTENAAALYGKPVAAHVMTAKH